MGNKPLCNNSELKPLPLFRYKIISVLGSGSFGTVFKIWDIDDNQVYALKKMEVSENGDNVQQEILKEIYILQNLQKIDPKPLLIPTFYGYSIENVDDKQFFILKFELKEGNLRSLIQEKQQKKIRFPFDHLRKWAITLIKGLAYLQTQNISHRDLKSENILYSYETSNEIRLTITDFGESSMNISRKNVLKTIHIRGTFSNMAPELRFSFYKETPNLSYNPYKSDAFSLGIVLLELATLKLPYGGNKEKNMDLTNLKSGNFEKEIQVLLKEMSDYYLPRSKNEEESKLIKNFQIFIAKLLVLEPEKRADFVEVFLEINKLATNHELLGCLSEEIRQENQQGQNSQMKIIKKNTLFPSKSEYLIPTNLHKRRKSQGSDEKDANNLPKDGCCEVILSSGDRYFGQFWNKKKHGKGILTFKNGDVYKGDFEEDEMEGYGEYKSVNGEKYIGEFKKGKRNGRGTLKIKGVGIYEGNWENGYQEGYGEFLWDNGDKYKGNYKQGQKCGKGVFESSNKKYEGEWKNDLKDGKGILYLNDGEKYRGEFKGDLFEGNGEYLTKEGKKLMGIWKQGEFIEKKEDCLIF